jgi:hypothetical protein
MSLESDGGMLLTRENRRTRRKTCPSATLSTTNPIWIEPGANPGHRGERPATNDLSHGTAIFCCFSPNRLSWLTFSSQKNTGKSLILVWLLYFWTRPEPNIVCSTRARPSDQAQAMKENTGIEVHMESSKEDIRKIWEGVLRISVRYWIQLVNTLRWGLLFCFYAAALREDLRLQNYSPVFRVHSFKWLLYMHFQILYPTRIPCWTNAQRVRFIIAFLHVILFSHNTETCYSWAVETFHRKDPHLNFPSLNHCSFRW